MARLLDGRPAAEAINRETLLRAVELRDRGIVPALALMRVGGGADWSKFADMAVEACRLAGVEVMTSYTPNTKRLRGTIENVNRDGSIHGVVVLRPLPDEDAEELLRRSLDPLKDVDGMAMSSLASVFVGHGKAFAPCPARAVMELLDHYGVPLAGRRAVIIGHGLVMGKPLAMLMLERGAAVTLCPGEAEADGFCRESDVIVSSRPLDPALLHEGQTVLYMNDGGLGDVQITAADVDAALAAGADAAPIPGGIDAVSYAILALHTVMAADLQYPF